MLDIELQRAEDRRYKTWITGSAGGARTSDLGCNASKLLE